MTVCRFRDHQRKRVRILYPFIGERVGGSHISALKLITNLDPSLFETVVALHQTEGPLADYMREEGLQFVAAPHVEFPDRGRRANYTARARFGATYLTRSLPALRDFARQGSYNIVHTNDGNMHIAWAPALFGLSTRLLWHHRGDPGALGTNLVAPLFADRIVTVSNFAKPTKPIRNINTRWSVVHSPFDHPGPVTDVTKLRDALRTETGASATARFVGYFGALTVRKRPVAMVDIVADYLTRHPGEDIHALIFGSSLPINDLAGAVNERARERGVADRIHLMGFRQPAEPLISAMDLLLLPGVNEPFGRTIIEAMMLGTPVIATRHGGNPEAITDGLTGFLVEPENSSAFVEPIHRLLNDSRLYRRITKTARTMALETYGIEKHVKAITDIYLGLARAKIEAKS